MGFCHRCGDLVHGANCLKCGGRSVMSVTSGLASTGSRNDPWISAYQNILEGGISKPNKRMSMPIPASPLNRPPPLVIQKQCHGCSKAIHQAKVYVEPGKPQFMYCEKCHIEKFTKGTCPACFKPVMSKTDAYITHNKKSWHTACFTCYKCRIDVSTQPLVDLRGRPCCEDCLMAQSGSEQSPLTTRPSPSMSLTFSHSSTPIDRSLASSPSPALTSSLHSSLSNDSDVATPASAAADNSRFLSTATSAGAPAKLDLSFSPLDLSVDRGSNFGSSPLSAQSNSSQSSLATSFRPTGSSGYTSGTSSTYSSLGRNPLESKVPSAIPTAASLTAGGVALQSPLAESSIHSFRRPSSALSVHSYPSSRAESPALRHDLHPEEQQEQDDREHQDQKQENHGHDEHNLDEQEQEDISQGDDESQKDEEGEIERPSSTFNRPLPESVSPPRQITPTPVFEPTRSPARFTAPYNEDDSIGIQRSGTSSGSIASSMGGGRYSKSNSSSSLMMAEAELAKRTSSMSTSSTTRPVSMATAPAPTPSTMVATPPMDRPRLARARSRSSVGPASSGGLIRARTEALMNQVHASPPANRPPSTMFSNTNSSFLPSRASAKSPASMGQDEKRGLSSRGMDSTANTTSSPSLDENKDTRSVLLEAEPNLNRSSLFRHGRQRSNTVGEAISRPEDMLREEDVVPSPPTQRRASVVPEGHCHKCHERVTENGVMLQGGFKFHIGCFLCHGCNQIFTESQFHVVAGRPYHPACVSMAPSIPSSGVVTKCQRCLKVTGNRWVRVAGSSYHPQCFTCQQCDKVLTSATPFYDVDGRVECGECCDERDRRPKIVPVARAADHFPVPPAAVPLDPSGPAAAAGMMASSGALSRSGSGYGSPSMSQGAASPLRSPGSPSFPLDHHDSKETAAALAGASSPVQMMVSPMAIRSEPPALTSLFSTRTRPLPKFGGSTNCPRCQQPVGVFDQVPGPKGDKWHKKCLNCRDCKKVLDSSALTRAEGEAYCRGCFTKANRVSVRA